MLGGHKMAEIEYSLSTTFLGDALVTWTGATESDTFQRFELAEAVAEISCHTVGTFGSATITYKGSNYEAEGVALTQMDGTDAVATDENIFSILDRPLFITPTHSGGTSESVTVYMLVRK